MFKVGGCSGSGSPEQIAHEPGLVAMRIVSIEAVPQPTFVEVLQRQLPAQEQLVRQASEIAQIVLEALSRRAENVHIIYLPEGAGRVAFGGELVRNQ
jgi:hypothetical protein